MNNIVLQDMQIQSCNEIPEMQTSYTNVTEEIEKCNGYDYWTFDDVVQMSGLTKKQVKKANKKEKMIVLC